MFGFLTQENTFYILAILLVLVIVLLIWNIRLEIKTKKLMRGKSGQSLEGSFTSMQNDIKSIEDFREEMRKYLTKVEKRLSTTIRGCENVTFNAFSGLESGGKSFATALLNEKGDGVIISSLHARERVSIFSKSVKNFKPDVELSEEEEVALTNARKSCNL
jgi:hypothetical protein